MKITTVIFDIGGVMVGLGRIRFFNQFGFAPGVVTAVGVECRGVERQSSVTVEGGERVLAV